MLDAPPPAAPSPSDACVWYPQQGDIVEPGRYWNPKLYIENAYGDPKEQFRHRVMFNEKGEAFISEKRTVKGTFMENLELDDFPFDVQVSFSEALQSTSR